MQIGEVLRRMFDELSPNHWLHSCNARFKSFGDYSGWYCCFRLRKLKLAIPWSLQYRMQVRNHIGSEYDYSVRQVPLNFHVNAALIAHFSRLGTYLDGWSLHLSQWGTLSGLQWVIHASSQAYGWAYFLAQSFSAATHGQIVTLSFWVLNFLLDQVYKSIVAIQVDSRASI